VLAGLVGSSAAAQDHAQVSAVAVNPTNPSEVWVCNRGNDSVSVIDATTGALLDEIDVGVWPRSLAFSPDGTRVFVASQRGNVPITKNFVTPFDGSEIRGQVDVIATSTNTVVDSITDVGCEPYGLAVAPNGSWFAVTLFRSGSVRVYDTDRPYNLIGEHQYANNLSFLPTGVTIADADSDRDFIADLAEPRGFVIRDDSSRIYVTHNTSPFISVLDLTLDRNGEPTAVAESKFSTNDYPFHPITAPTPVQNLASQGLPRFQEDIALSPDGLHALVPAVLHNVNHDVNHGFGPLLEGDFANRVYPALTVVDAAQGSYGQGGDDSNRLHHELDDDLTPAEYVPYGNVGFRTADGVMTLGGHGEPVSGGTFDLRVTGMGVGDIPLLMIGFTELDLLLPGQGTVHLNPIVALAMSPTGTFTGPISPDPAFDGAAVLFQAAVFSVSEDEWVLSNGVRAVVGATGGFGVNKMGYRAGQPSRAAYSSDGASALMLNRGSEDVFLYDVSGSDMTLRTVFPPRHGFVERAALDTSTPMGDLPLGMAVVPDASTSNDDADIYIVNETTSTMSHLWVDFDAGVVLQASPQVSTLSGPDSMTLSERIGQELFEDASRAQTAGNFNNSCASCHFEGGADGNVWQRPAGPRSTMPVYGGTLATGAILWKGNRVNMGETGPMFGGENGGHGLFTDAEQAGLRDYHEAIPVPLNPHLDLNGDYSVTAELGKDLFFGTNETGLNPTGRDAGCTQCHPDDDGGAVRAYTLDFLDPTITGAEEFGRPGTVWENCFELQENILGPNLRNVNTAVNSDIDSNGTPESDRNFDGWIDFESYTPMNADDDDDFTRDDPNSYPCAEFPGFPEFGDKVFLRKPDLFVIPTKLGVFSTGPYFHDHSAVSLRALLDPAIQPVAGKYGDPAYPTLQKLFNGEHSIREQVSGPGFEGLSKVQLTLTTLAVGSTFDADIEAILEYIQSL
jgi:YVTN family beta-propeller protein